MKEMLSKNALVIYAVLWTVSAATSTVADPVVSTAYGSLKGKLSSVKGTDQVGHEYLGIPFAKPPLGSLRFSAPQPPEPWDGIRDATNQPAMCLQDMQHTAQLMKEVMLEFPMPATSEDCLYLNVYTSREAATKEAKLPVMVWIHGGGFKMGGASQYDGSVLAIYGNVVVVVIQYRLGILGFLSTSDEHARGNWGFLDQVAALQWVQENIKSFGGDPNSVTIFGESAGGASVSAHILSPLSTGLFHKAISESGVAVLSSLITSNQQLITKMIANVTGCDDKDSATFVKCLRGKNEEDLVSATKTIKFINIADTIDGVFLPSPLEEILKTQKFNKVPYLLGVNNHETGWLMPKRLFPPGWEAGVEKDQILAVMNKMFTAKLAVNELIAAEYFRDTEDPTKLRDLATEMLGDIFIVLPTINAAKDHKEAGVPVYLYEFQHRPSIYKDKRPSFVKADHGDEINFVFGGCFWNGQVKIPVALTEEEMKLCRVMMAYWANFARNGTPNGDGLVHWPVYDKNEEYMALGLEQKTGTKLKGDIMKFLTNLLSEKNKKPSEESGEQSAL
ncbi:carboxylesterase 5A-like isoform X1 [Acipenser oxyrinchus oxyrinchus]|uniref:Carboxylic ester hydrolase n=1 Tax=Acipenser oxyrinchus oxyrinchus TaxID=40147 RepID=A0AAD8G570_ACIOX|nr:carboxylesterase 5A-like isoform X1 [Acipenser oxyrinchus oxyrinchus]